MEQKFINLRQAGRTVNEYAAEFSKLSRFASYMVFTEENRARRFQQGLNIELQWYVISFKYKDYIEVLTVAREQEQLSGLMMKVPTGSIKRSIGQLSGRILTRQVDATPPKWQMVLEP